MALRFHRAAGPVPDAASPTRQAAEVSAPQLLPLRAARRRLLPRRRQARTRWRRQRLSPHPARRRRPTRHRGTPRHLSLDQTDAPALLISAGIGATPVLAMLHALGDERSDREIWGLHSAPNRREHSFAAEARALLASLPNARRRVYYSRPGPNDVEGRDFDIAGLSPGQCWLTSIHPAMPRHTCAARPVSWTRSAPLWRRSGSTPRASTPSHSDPHRD